MMWGDEGTGSEVASTAWLDECGRRVLYVQVRHAQGGQVVQHGNGGNRDVHGSQHHQRREVGGYSPFVIRCELLNE